MPKMIVPPPPRRPKHPLIVLAPFLLIALLFAGTDLLALHRVRAIRHRTAEIVSDTLTSIELVARMERDIDDVKLLTDRHVLARDLTSMRAIEQQIAAAQADFATTAENYLPLLTQPGEAEKWHELQAGVAGLQPPLQATLAISRNNDDAGARRALEALDVRFAAIFRDAVALMAINHAGADQMLQEVGDLQRSSAKILEGLALVGIALSTAVGASVARLVLRREALQRRYSELLHDCNEELDAFAGRVAHDLRGPLTTATVAAERLIRQADGPQVPSANALRRSLDRMGVLIEDLLALSRMQSAVHEAVCDPAPTAARLREDVAPRAESEGLDLVVDVEPAQVQCSEALLRQAIWNLLDNAMKYRRREVHSIVEVLGHPSDHRWYELSVRDNGVGMAPDDASHAFDAFYRASRTRSERGLGLGLSIVKRAIEVCGGTVSVTSDLGLGSTFVMRVPLAERRAQAAEEHEQGQPSLAGDRMLPASTR